MEPWIPRNSQLKRYIFYRKSLAPWKLCWFIGKSKISIHLNLSETHIRWLLHLRFLKNERTWLETLALHELLDLLSLKGWRTVALVLFLCFFLVWDAKSRLSTSLQRLAWHSGITEMHSYWRLAELVSSEIMKKGCRLSLARFKRYENEAKFVCSFYLALWGH